MQAFRCLLSLRFKFFGYLPSGFLGCMVVLFLFFTLAIVICILINSIWEFWVLSTMCYVSSSCFPANSHSNQNNMVPYWILICISLVISDVEQFFTFTYLILKCFMGWFIDCVASVCTHMCVQAPRGGHRVSSSTVSTFVFWDRVSQTTWSLPFWLGWLVSELSGSACLHLQNTGVTGPHDHAQIFHEW